ncbi:MAG: hypothetical protein AAFX65_05600 [Cyanobacteria bacterium J06638_7]
MLARHQRSGVGQVISELARRGLAATHATPTVHLRRCGLPVLPHRPDGVPVDLDLVNQLRVELMIHACALLDPWHVHHNGAHRWFAAHHHQGWASCPLTENAVLRILGNPRFPNSPGPPAVVATVLNAWLGHPRHHIACGGKELVRLIPT